MKTRAEVISILKKFKQDSAQKYGIKTLGLFGSCARNQQDEASDVDVVVTLQEPDFFTMEKIKEELERLLPYRVDVVNFRESLRESFKQNILKDAIYI